MNQQYQPSAANPCEEVQALIPAYSMNMTDPDETRFVEATLAGCPEAAAELEEFRRLSDALLDSADQVPAPTHIAYRLIEQAAATKNPPSASNDKPAAPVIYPRPRRLMTFAAGIAAALILIVALGLFYRQSEQQQAQLGEQVALQNEIISLLSRGDFVNFPLTPEDNPSSSASGVILCHPDEQVAMLRVENFPPLPPGKVYQLWLRTEDERFSGGLFHTDADGKGILVFEAPIPLIEFRYAGITTEPAKGSSAPTTQPVVRGQLY